MKIASTNLEMVLSHELGQHKWYGRLAMEWADADLTPLTMELKADARYLLELDLRDVGDITGSLLGSLFDALASNTTSLQLELDMITFESALIFDVCNALIVNATVVRLSLSVFEIGLRTSRLFAKMLRQNRALTSITLNSPCFKAKPKKIISRALLENNIVTSFELSYTSNNHVPLRIRGAIGRNLGLLNLAVKFVTRTSLTKRSAQAFETLHGAPSLASQVSDVTGKSERDALADIQAADWYIRTHYLYLTGVVKCSLECHPSSQTQADALNEQCWQAIAKFLVVSDVRDE
ncbi:hypothetical protein MTO96_037119 [Rhipicephalus appendiculatus]